MTSDVHSASRGMDRRADQPAAASSAVLHRLLVESVVDCAIFALDRSGSVLSWNRGAERLKGYTADEIIGRQHTLFYPPEEIQAGKPARLLEQAARDGRAQDEGWRVRRDASRFWAEVVATALRDDAGAVVGFAKLTRDLTAQRAAEEHARHLAATEAARVEWERRAGELFALSERLKEQTAELEAQTEEAQSLAEELEQTNESLASALAETERARDVARSARAEAEAEAANVAKSAFLAMMSHELRTPLNAIAGYTELLEMGLHGPVTAAQLDALQRIRRSERHLLSLIEDILSFARIEAGRLTVEAGDVPLRALVAEIEALIEPQLQGKRLTFDYRGCASSLVAHADEEKVRQIILNLLSNAIKFTPDGGTIIVSGVGRRDVVELHVRDTGRGIPAGMLEVIFEPFVQLDRTLTNPKAGTGLGLAISRELARAMGGELSVESEPGSGAVFTLLLPVAR